MYDVTKYQCEHPGGRLPLKLHKYKDCTELFRAAGHSKHALKLLQMYRVASTKETKYNHVWEKMRRHNDQQAWRKFFVFVLSIIATSTTIFVYWNCICNKSDAGESHLDSIADLVYEIMTSIYLPTQLLLGSYLAADYLLVEDCSTNFDLLKRAGYSMTYVLSCMATVYIFSGPFLGIIFWVLLQDSQPYISVTMVAKVVTTYVLSDMLFESVHKWMHYKQPGVHLMHHVAIFSTACTGLIMDFTDYALEFWASKFPIIIILGTNALSMYDGFACVVSMSLAILIDICNHDAWCKFPHYYHHSTAALSFGVMPFEMISTHGRNKSSLNQPLRNELESALLD